MTPLLLEAVGERELGGDPAAVGVRERRHRLQEPEHVDGLHVAPAHRGRVRAVEQRDALHLVELHEGLAPHGIGVLDALLVQAVVVAHDGHHHVGLHGSRRVPERLVQVEGLVAEIERGLAAVEDH